MKLEEVKAAFEGWRGHRTKRMPIPEELWSLVRLLRPHYTKYAISKALKMNNTQLERGCERKSLSFEEEIHCNGFAVGYLHKQESVAPIIQQKTKTPCACELTLSGPRKSLRINIDMNELANVLPILEPYL